MRYKGWHIFIEQREFNCTREFQYIRYKVIAQFERHILTPELPVFLPYIGRMTKHEIANFDISVEGYSLRQLVKQLKNQIDQMPNIPTVIVNDRFKRRHDAT